jgi:regulator of sigma E protease
MAVLTSTLYVILLILVIVTLFNIIIFVHELGHFLAARWRGLQVDRFQIWFGKPIWKKTINGVQYGLGWIPAGGFVALPQMAPMESIEGASADGENRTPLPPISAMDKITVAFAGPLFSMLLALSCAFIVTKVGKPRDFIPETRIGYVDPEKPAYKAGIRTGDRILEINGRPVDGFQGSLDSIFEQIVLSRGDQIRFTIERPGELTPITLETGFEREQTRWFQRSGLRDVGIDPAGDVLVGYVMQNSPADKAGIVPGDELISVDGIELISIAQLSAHMKARNWQPLEVVVQSGSNGIRRTLTLTPETPIKPKDQPPMIGVSWDTSGQVDTRIVHPGAYEQVKDSVRMMWVTLTSLISPQSSIGVDQLTGPVGIAKIQYQLLQSENGWRRVLAFMVLFNVNLAILNMLPFPVLDGGHITLAVLEKIAGRPVKAKPLEIVQTACALALISLMLYVTSKDVGDSFGRSRDGRPNIEFAD